MSGYHQTFSHQQLRALDIGARVSSCLSLFGSSFTIISFLSYPPLRKPVNRLAFSIAIANIFACLGYSWGQYPIDAGRRSAWCQTQGLFVQWFVMTDPLLVMIMAFNVLLTVRTKRNATELKRVDIFAILLAFLLPGIPALVFLCWRPNGTPLYGPATMWCWIGKEHAMLRLWAFYVPIWCCILITISLFALSGKQILLVRKKVKAAKADCALHKEDPPLRGPDGFPPPRERRFSSFARAFIAPNKTQGSVRLVTPKSDREQGDPPISAELKALEPLAPIQSLDLEADPEHNSFEQSSVNERPSFTLPWPPDSPTTTLNRSASNQAILRSNEQNSSRKASRFDTIHWKYAKFAFLCTIVLCITWVPISINRVYNNFIAPDHQIYGLYLTSVICMPLHGFGNFVIYATISWAECKEFLSCSGGRSSRRPSAVQFQEPKSVKMRERARNWAEKARQLSLQQHERMNYVRRESTSGWAADRFT